jgi:hypothetical protein
LFYLFTKADDVDGRWDGFGVIYVICHVDDMPVASNSTSLLDWFEQQVKLEFKITSTALDWFVGISIEISKFSVSYHQEHFVVQLLQKFKDLLLQFCGNGRGGIKTKSTPGVPGKVLSKASCPQSQEEEDAVAGLPYAELVGAFLYLTNTTRSDIMVAVGYCSRFMSRFGMDHWIAALHILQYLAKYPKLPTTYVHKPDGSGLVVMYEVDASYADCPDTARSRWGCCGYLAGGVFDVKTAVLKNVQPSTGSAEQSALAKCVLRVLASRQYIDDFGFPQYEPTPIGEDNMAALLNSKNPVKSKMARHLHVYHHITRENQMEFKTISVYRRASADMSADMYTKLLGVFLHWKHTNTTHNLSSYREQ